MPRVSGKVRRKLCRCPHEWIANKPCAITLQGADPVSTLKSHRVSLGNSVFFTIRTLPKEFSMPSLQIDSLSYADSCFSPAASRDGSRRLIVRMLSAALALFVVLSVIGCGSGGYPGGAVVGLSSSAITIDAGQSFSFTAKVTANPLLTWSLNGANCSGAACGTVTSSDGATAV